MDYKLPYGRQPIMEDNFQHMTTYYRRQPSLEDDLQWKKTSDKTDMAAIWQQEQSDGQTANHEDQLVAAIQPVDLSNSLVE